VASAVDTLEEAAEVLNGKKISIMSSVISIKNGSVFQHDRLILNDINLEIKEGEFVYLIGRSGSGKSSLLKTLYADLPAKSGMFNIVGFNLNEIKRKDIPMLRRKIGIVFQDFQLLYDRNVEQNLSFVLKATGWEDETKIKRRIDAVLQLVRLKDKRLSMPHQLSGGEQQSIAIARALLNNPSVILADEPTGNLDPETTNDVMKLLTEICDTGTTVLMATHNYNLILKYPSRVISCANGTISESAK
jgi:cell division transport system ATP-binding protein